MSGNLPRDWCNCAPLPMALSNPSPRVLAVNMPISNFGVTIAVLDGDGNLTIKMDQPRPLAPCDETGRLL